MNMGLLSGVALGLFTGLPLAAQLPSNVPSAAPAQSPPATVPPLATASPSPALPPVAPRQHSLNMEAVPVSRGGESRVLDEKAASRLGYEYGHSSNARDKRSASMTVNTNKESLQVTVRNFGPQPDQAQVEGYFIAQYVGHPWPKNTPDYVQTLPQEYVFDHSVKPLAVAPGSTGSLMLDSVEVRTLLTKFAFTSTGYYNSSVTTSSASSNEVGTKLRGWIVRLVADGKVLAVRASTSSYEELGKDNARLQALMAIPLPSEPRNRRTIGPFSN